LNDGPRVLCGKAGSGRATHPEGVTPNSPGSRSALWVGMVSRVCFPTPKGLHRCQVAPLCNPFGVLQTSYRSAFPGCAARPWAFGCDPFGVRAGGKEMRPLFQGNAHLALELARDQQFFALQ